MSRIGEDLKNILELVQQDFASVSREKRLDLFKKSECLRAYKLDNYREKIVDPFSSQADVTDEKWNEFTEICDSVFDLFSFIRGKSQQGFSILIYQPMLVQSNTVSGLSPKKEVVPRYDEGLITIKFLYDPTGDKQEDRDREESIEIIPEARVIIQAMEAVPPDRIKGCPECAKYFVQTTRKEKMYCSPRCQNNVSLRKMRQGQKRK